MMEEKSTGERTQIAERSKKGYKRKETVTR